MNLGACFAVLAYASGTPVAEPSVTQISPPRSVSPAMRVSQPTVRGTAKTVKVLLVGDSLSVGPFGGALQELLVQRYGRDEVRVYASCGSSPEDWLSSTKVFVSRCGHRRFDSRGSLVREYDNGKPPPSYETPKLGMIFARCQPSIVLVQLGTNWMDGLVSGSRDEARYRKIVREFVGEIREHVPAGARIIWLLPPDASRYPKAAKDFVQATLEKSSRELRFSTIDARDILGRYRQGETGGDGVHLGDEAGRRWAREVDKMIAPAWD